MGTLRTWLLPRTDPAYDDFYIRHFVAPILPLAMLSAALSSIILGTWFAILNQPHAAIYLGAGSLLCLLAWLCWWLARSGNVHTSSMVVVLYGGVISSMICWVSHDQEKPILRAFPMCMILVVIGSFFALRLSHLLLGYLVTIGPTVILMETSGEPGPGNTEIYRSLLVFTLATAITFFLLGHRIKRSYFDLLVDHKERALRDSLTGLYNLQGWFAKMQETTPPVVVLFLDLDHFKQVNDRFGHVAGDRVLRRFGELLTATLEPTAITGRFGGEEFVIGLSNTSLDEAESVAEHIRQACANLDDVVGKTTVSVGFAGQLPGEALEDTVHRADRALLAAKAAGRDRVELAAVPILTTN